LTKYSRIENSGQADASGAVLSDFDHTGAAGLARPSHHSRYALTVLCAVYFVHMMDRSVLLVLLEQIRHEFMLSDSQLALLSGVGYALPFAIAGLPLGMVADRVSRKRLLAVLVLAWSTFTAIAATSRNFAMLLVTRAGVGASEAGAPPAILSMVADFYPGTSRAGAVSVIYVAPLLGLMAGSYIGGTGLYAHAAGPAIAGLGLWSFFGSVYMGPSYGVCLASVPAPLRSTLMSLVVVTCNLVGAAGGPQIAGILSDTLRAHGDSLALPHSLSAVLLFGTLPAWLFWRAARQSTDATYPYAGIEKIS
jgi:hypothetical protein